jgi:hypothetical protein
MYLQTEAYLHTLFYDYVFVICLSSCAKVGQGTRSMAQILKHRTLSGVRNTQKKNMKTQKYRRTSGWNIFYKEHNSWDLSSQIGRSWRLLPKEVKDVYDDRASSINNSRAQFVHNGFKVEEQIAPIPPGHEQGELDDAVPPRFRVSELLT